MGCLCSLRSYFFAVHTLPVSESSMTVRPLLRMATASDAPVMTGLPMARPRMAAWELAPPFSVMMPAAFRSRGTKELVVSGMTRISPARQRARASSSVGHTHRLAAGLAHAVAGRR